MAGHDIIVVGGSAGSLEPIIELASGLPVDFPAAVFVVIHSSPTSPSLLPNIIERSGPLPAFHPTDGELIAPGQIYVAQPDYHLLLEVGRVRVTRGPKENHFRPAIDPLFRSAALAYGPRVVGVVLSGGLDDGAAGLWAIKTRGGIAIVQDPKEALVSSMPANAMRQSRVDYCLPMGQLSSTLIRLAVEPAASPEAYPVPEGLETETRIAMQDNAMSSGVAELGERTLFTCPECHGSLLRMKIGGGLRFRCHTGHAYTANALLAELTETIENDLWNAVRSVEESSFLLDHIAAHVREAGDLESAALYKRKAAEARQRAEQVRGVVMRHEALSADTLQEKSA
jgi:two-component system chemotaxis response regulator CheB